MYVTRRYSQITKFVLHVWTHAMWYPHWFEPRWRFWSSDFYLKFTSVFPWSIDWWRRVIVLFGWWSRVCSTTQVATFDQPWPLHCCGPFFEKYKALKGKDVESLVEHGNSYISSSMQSQLRKSRKTILNNCVFCCVSLTQEPCIANQEQYQLTLQLRLWHLEESLISTSC